MKYELKSIGIWSFIKISFFMNLVFGAIIGFFYALFFGLIMSIAGSNSMYRDMGVDPSDISIGVLIILFPIIFGIMAAFFQTLILTILVGIYNLFTKLTGGLILNLNPIEEPAVQAVPTATVVTNLPSIPTPTVPPPPPPMAEVVKPSEPVVPEAPPIIETEKPIDPIFKPEAQKPNDSSPEDKNDNPPKW